MEKSKKDCIFCRIINKELAADVVFENERILAFKDINPSAPVHILVVPKKHIESLSQVKVEDQSLLGETQLVIIRLAKKLQIEDSFRVVLNNGRKAGQIVFHLHYHLLGGWQEKPRSNIGKGGEL